MYAVAGIVCEKRNDAAQRVEVGIIDNKVTSNSEQPVCVKAIEHRVVKGVHTIDKNEVKLTIALHQSWECKFRLCFNEMEKIDPGVFEVDDTGAIPLGALEWIDHRVSGVRASLGCQTDMK